MNFLQELGIGIVVTGGAVIGLSYGTRQLGNYLDNRRIRRNASQRGYQTRFDFDGNDNVSFSREPLENFDPYHWRRILNFP